MSEQTAPFTIRATPDFGEVIDGLADRRGLNRSAFIRALVQEEALRLAAAAEKRERERD
jgi:uncharacterized protein (DUF1778 family)